LRDVMGDDTPMERSFPGRKYRDDYQCRPHVCDLFPDGADLDAAGRPQLIISGSIVYSASGARQVLEWQ
jgi:hypothetical protein